MGIKGFLGPGCVDKGLRVVTLWSWVLSIWILVSVMSSIEGPRERRDLTTSASRGFASPSGIWGCRGLGPGVEGLGV